jgi:hypothetical protein
MPASGRLSARNSAVATLLYHVGIATDTVYGPWGSGCQPDSAPAALRQHFGYSAEDVAARADFSDAQWIAKIKTDLNASRPIWYFGGDETGLDNGHAFVLDGFFILDQVNASVFHFNWGWSGFYDGYYMLSNLTPGGRGYNHDQGAVFGIHPVSAASLAAPSRLRARATSRTRSSLTWRDHATRETGYRIERKIGSEAWTPIAGVPANATRFLDRALTPDTTYRYRVRAVNAQGTSAWATSAAVTTPK